MVRSASYVRALVTRVATSSSAGTRWWRSSRTPRQAGAGRRSRPMPGCSSSRPRRPHRLARDPVLLDGSEALPRCRTGQEHLDRRPSSRGPRDADRAGGAATSAPTPATERVRLMIRPAVVAEPTVPNYVRVNPRAVGTVCRARSTDGPQGVPAFRSRSRIAHSAPRHRLGRRAHRSGRRLARVDSSDIASTVAELLRRQLRQGESGPGRRGRSGVERADVSPPTN